MKPITKNKHQVYQAFLEDLQSQINAAKEYEPKIPDANWPFDDEAYFFSPYIEGRRMVNISCVKKVAGLSFLCTYIGNGGVSSLNTDDENLLRAFIRDAVWLRRRHHTLERLYGSYQLS